MDNQTITLLNSRRSLRSFSDREIEEHVKQAIKATTLRAPTAGNMILYSVVEVTSQSIKDELVVLCDNQPMIAKAPMVWVFLADMTKWINYYHESNSVKTGRSEGLQWRQIGMGDFLLSMSDAIIAAQTAVIAAEAYGLGSCYIGDVYENYEKTSTLLDLPPHTAIATMVIFGYPKDGFGSKSAQSLRPPTDYVFMENRYLEPHLPQLLQAYSRQEEQMRNQKRLPFNNTGTISDYYYFRKHQSPFMEEMNRSAKVMVDRWLHPDVPTDV